MAVVNHEKALKEQAKKMGVDSLRSGDKVGWTLNLIWIKVRLQFFPISLEKAEESAEMKICKVAVTNVFMWIAIWTPYAGEFYLSFNDSLQSYKNDNISCRCCHDGCVWRQKQDHPTDGTVPLNGGKGCNMFQSDRVRFVSSQVRILIIYGPKIY